MCITQKISQCEFEYLSLVCVATHAKLTHLNECHPAVPAGGTPHPLATKSFISPLLKDSMLRHLTVTNAPSRYYLPYVSQLFYGNCSYSFSTK